MPSEPLVLIEHRKLSDHVAANIEDRILSGVWGPGYRLPSEPVLCEQLGVSRSVIRDATQALAARGLLDIKQGVGTCVSMPSDAAYVDAMLLLLLRGDATVRDAARARAEVEVMAVGLAAQHRETADIEDLRSIFDEIVRAASVPDVQAAREADFRFHQAIINATHLPVLVALLRPVGAIIQRTSQAPSQDARFLDLEAHRAVLESIESGEAVAAQDAMREHFAFIDDPQYASLHDQLVRDVPLIDRTLAEIRSVS